MASRSNSAANLHRSGAAASTNSLSGGSLEDITKKSIDLLSRIVQKTPLNHKLLSKPPFRYLHDLTMEIINNTGAAAGLFNESEMNSETCKVV